MRLANTKTKAKKITVNANVYKCKHINDANTKNTCKGNFSQITNTTATKEK